jgi:hypothetical protein
VALFLRFGEELGREMRIRVMRNFIGLKDDVVFCFSVVKLDLKSSKFRRRGAFFNMKGMSDYCCYGL